MWKVWSREQARIEPSLLMPDGKTSVLFVCMGNICRSPTAEAVTRKLVEQAGLQDWITVDSAGTHDYQVGRAPDNRAQEAARRRGYDLSSIRARQITLEDFEDFDLLLAMDSNNLGLLKCMCPFEYRSKIRLLMEYARTSKASVIPDPYSRGPKDFDKVLDYIEDACGGLVNVLSRRNIAIR